MNKFNKLYTSLINENPDRYDESISKRLKTLLHIHRDPIQKSELGKYDGPSLWQALEAISDDLSQAHLQHDWRASARDVSDRLQRILISRAAQIQNLGLEQPLRSIANDIDRIMQ